MKKHPLTKYREKHKLSLREFGLLVRVQKAAVHKWESGAIKPSIESAKLVDAVTGGAVPKHVLRPDVWGAP